jgi:hypothetical protein
MIIAYMGFGMLGGRHTVVQAPPTNDEAAAPWRVGKPTTFDIGTAKGVTLARRSFGRGSLSVGGADLYDVLDRKCSQR